MNVCGLTDKGTRLQYYSEEKSSEASLKYVGLYLIAKQSLRKQTIKFSDSQATNFTITVDQGQKRL